MLKIKTLEEFKETKRQTYFSYQETPDGFSYLLNCGVRVACTWQEEYERYCDLRKKYIERITPLCNLLKGNKGQAFSIKELQEKLNDTTIKSGTINTLFAEGVIQPIDCEIINERGQKLLIRKITWADGNN
jgi:hypothetical protein